MNGELLEVKRIQVEGLEGREFEVDLFQGKAKAYYRVIYDNKIIYMHGVISVDKNKNTEVVEFLESFRLLK
jgi:hypothetical protein